MTYAIINYHYIRERGDNGIHPCTIERFHAQLRRLGEHFTIVSPSELYECARSGQPGRYAAVSFDDGLAEHARVAFPALREAGLCGAFFPLGLPLQEAKLPPTHKLHVLLGRLSTPELVGRLEHFFGGVHRVPRDRLLNSRRRFDDLLTANLKETLIALPPEERNRFIETVFAEVVPDEAALARETFMSAGELETLARAGMEIGSHTYSHLSLETLDGSMQRDEIERGTAVVAGIIGRAPQFFSYPHGRYTSDTLDILAAGGFKRAFILGARDVGAGDRPLEIPRYDTNDMEAANL